MGECQAILKCVTSNGGTGIQVAPRHRRMPSTIAAGLPPLRTLGEPVTFTSPHAAGIDLNIDFETEIKPFIGRKLVSWLTAVDMRYFMINLAAHGTCEIAKSARR